MPPTHHTIIPQRFAGPAPRAAACAVVIKHLEQVRVQPRTSALNMTLPAAAARAPAAVDRRDRRTDGRTDGHPTVTQTLHRILCGRRQ